jgi:hypothetical protein
MKTYVLCLLMMIVGACGFGYTVGYHFGHKDGIEEGAHNRDAYYEKVLEGIGGVVIKAKEVP